MKVAARTPQGVIITSWTIGGQVNKVIVRGHPSQVDDSAGRRILLLPQALGVQGPELLHHKLPSLAEKPDKNEHLLARNDQHYAVINQLGRVLYGIRSQDTSDLPMTHKDSFKRRHIINITSW